MIKQQTYSDLRPYEYLMRGPKLNFGSGGNLKEGFVNVDKEPRTKADVICDAETDHLPCCDEIFGFILMSHVLEHLRDPFKVMDEMWRVLRPGGHLLIVVTYGTSDLQLSTPDHRTAYIPLTFSAFQTARYQDGAGCAAYEGHETHDWEIVRIDLTSGTGWPSWLLKLAEPYLRNLFVEIYCVLRKPLRGRTNG